MVLGLVVDFWGLFFLAGWMGRFVGCFAKKRVLDVVFLW
jgi:hypothetical protein